MAPLQIDVEPRGRPREHFLPAVAHLPRAGTVRTEPFARKGQSLRDGHRIRVALAGCGVVGGGLVRLLHESAGLLASRFDLQVELTGILVRDLERERNLPLDRGLLTNDLDDFLALEADIIVEAVGGHEPARTIATHALRRGKKFVTANKELVAAHGVSLSLLAEENDGGLDFGAAVGGSAPVISTLRDLLGACTPVSVRGILNGTSNYVISEIERGVTAEAALESARARGLAELDCSRDLDGRDAAAKLAIIAWIAFGIPPAALQIRRTGLPIDLERLVRFASLVGGHVRLIAECCRVGDDSVLAAVEPTIVTADSGFGRTTLEDNRVEVDLGWGAPLTVSGPGAGSKPTATALLGDILGTARPRNERGTGGGHLHSAADERRHAWLVSARVRFDELHSVTEAAGIRIAQPIVQPESSAIVTRAVAWSEIERLIITLESLGAEPSVARYDLAVDGKEAAP